MLWNLVSSPFGGMVFPVSPSHASVLGIQAWASVADLPTIPDLAVIASDASAAPDAIRDCGRRGVRAAIVLSSDGPALERELHDAARSSAIRIVGPESLGVMSPATGLNATYASQMAQSGTVSFISQSSALCAAVLEWSVGANVGFRALLSLGSMSDVGWADLLDYFGRDPLTRSIVMYIESVGQARAFLSAAREIALAKPIIALKVGRTRAGAEVVHAHRGAIMGDDRVLDAAFRRCGILRVDTIADLFYMAEVLGKQPRPRGPRLAIVTNAGGPGALAIDALVARGGQLASLSPETVAALDTILPASSSHRNPVDVHGDADAARYVAAVDVALRDEHCDGVLAILTPQLAIEPTDAAQRMARLTRGGTKPLLASWMGGPAARAGEAILERADIPTFSYPDTAAKTFTDMWRYSSNLRALYETPLLPAHTDELATHTRLTAASKIEASRRAGHTVLSEAESNDLISSYGIPVAASLVASAGDKHGSTAPVHGPELMIGSHVDAVFGPVLVFGAGGPFSDVLQDRALGFPPLNTTLAKRLMEQTRVWAAIERVPSEVEALAELLVRFSYLVVDHPWIQAVEMNPVCATDAGFVALNARVVLYGHESDRAAVPPLAIRPYPVEYTWPFRLAVGSVVTIRPIRPEDEPLMVAFHERLSERSVYYRYFHAVRLGERVSHDRLARICFIDYDRDMALVADSHDEQGRPHIVGVGRLTKVRGLNAAEFAVIVADELQGQGLGRELLARLVEVGRIEGMERIQGDILPDNRSMQVVAERVGFTCHYSAEEGVVRAQLILSTSPSTRVVQEGLAADKR